MDCRQQAIISPAKKFARTNAATDINTGSLELINFPPAVADPGYLVPGTQEENHGASSCWLLCRTVDIQNAKAITIFVLSRLNIILMYE